jgi:hypothetical protein
MELFWIAVIMFASFMAGKNVGTLREQARQEYVKEFRRITDINRGRNYWQDGR